MDTLPSELILNLFKYFDVFELIRLKEISKEWYNIISKMNLSMIDFDDIIMYRNSAKMLNLKNNKFEKLIEREKTLNKIIEEQEDKIYLDETGREYSRLYLKCHYCPLGIYAGAGDIPICCYIHRKNDKMNHLKHLSFKRVTIKGVVFNNWLENFRHQLENIDYFVLKTIYFPSNCKFNTMKYSQPIIQFENEHDMFCKTVKKIDIHCQKCIDIQINMYDRLKNKRVIISTNHTELLDHPFNIEFKQCFLYLSRNLLEALEQIQGLNISLKSQSCERIFYKFKNYASEHIVEDTKLEIKQFLATQYPNIEVFFIDNDLNRCNSIPDDFINEDVKELVPDVKSFALLKRTGFNVQSETEVLLYLRYENYIFDVERNVLKVLKYGTEKKIKLFIYKLLLRIHKNLFIQAQTLKRFIDILLEIPTIEIFVISDDLNEYRETMIDYFKTKNIKNIKNEDIMYYVKPSDF